MKTLISMLTAAVLLSSGAAMAADSTGSAVPVAKPAVTAAAPAKVKTPKIASIQSEKSKKCSADADAKSLHGKERKSFRHACMKAA